MAAGLLGVVVGQAAESGRGEGHLVDQGACREARARLAAAGEAANDGAGGGAKNRLVIAGGDWNASPAAHPDPPRVITEGQPSSGHRPAVARFTLASLSRGLSDPAGHVGPDSHEAHARG